MPTRPTGMGRRAFLLSALSSLLALAGCGNQSLGMPGGGADGQVAFQQRATAVARAWRDHPPDSAWRTGFVPLQDLTLAPPQGFPDVTAKQAFLAGLFRLRGSLPDRAGTGWVRFHDGTRLRVPLSGAHTAYGSMDRGGAACGPCPALTVTGARLSTATLRTSRGVATVPVWLFTVAGLSGPVGQVAVSPGAIGLVPEPPALPPLPMGAPLAAAQDLTGVGGESLRFRVGISPCDKDVRARVLEADGLVVVGAAVSPGDSGSPCPAVMMLDPVRVPLAAPLGGRLVVDVVTGRPLALNPEVQAR